MKSQFVGGAQNGSEQKGVDLFYLDHSMRGLIADTRGGPSESLIADVKIMQEFAKANPDKANVAGLNAWVEKVLGTDEPNKAAPTTARSKPGMSGNF
ncbi:MAG: hypothetical protein Q8K65_08830 [Alphaproteobacteria bacterium]|nr:hypothetical protein [Alphaproteobacteria bacterium]